MTIIGTIDELARRLDGAPAVVELPADRPRPTALSGDVHRAPLALDPVTLGRLGDERHREAVLAAALAAYVHLLTGTDDVVVGAVGRSGDDAGERGVPLRLAVDGRSRLGGLVADVTDDLDDWPLDGRPALDELAPAAMGRSEAKHPVFQVAVAPPPAGPPDGPPCDLVVEHDHAGVVTLVGSAQLYTADRVRRAAGHLATLVQAAALATDQEIGSISLLTPDEADRLARWNDTGTPRRGADVIDPWFRMAARGHPDATAVEHRDRAVSHRDLLAAADGLAARLVESGAGPDVPVVVSLDRSVEMIVAVLGVLAAGSPYVPVDPAYPLARRRHMVADSDARIVVTAGALADDLDADDVEVIHLDHAEEPAPAPATHGPAVVPENLGYVIYTSGSTGTPKGVALTQLALANLIDWQLHRPDFAPGRRTLQFASLSFDVSFQEIATTLASGGTLVLVDELTRRDPNALLDHVIAHRVERVFLPFVALRGLAEASVASGRVPEHLREVYTAGEQLVVDDTVRRFFATLPDCLLENQYGPSESHVVSAHRLTGPAAGWPTLPPIGDPIQNTALHVLGGTHHRRPIGVPGELFIAGDCLARGYLGRPDLTAERFSLVTLDDGTQHRMYRTGDRARWLESGAVEFLGRVDHQVKFRGFRIEPGEVGAVLSAAPGVSRCVAAVRALDGVGARLVAYVVPIDGQPPDLRAVHRYARDHLPEHMVPSHLAVVDELPLTPSGKVDTASLPDPAFDRSILDSELVAPRTSSEATLAAIWSELLGADEIGVHDDFFDLGGDSLMAVELFARVSRELGRELPLGALGQRPTIAGLAELLAEDHTDSWRPLVPIRVDGDRTPLFCVHGGSGNVASFPLLARALPPGRPVYALQWDGLDGSRGSRTIEAMAERYLAEIRTVQANGPYLLAGQCIGGLIAQEIARRLRAAGDDVPLVVMWDSPNLSSPDFVAARRRSELERIVRSPWAERRRARYHARRLLRRPLLDKHRADHGSVAMVQAAWRHAVPAPEGRTVYVASGVSSGSSLALSGHWTDGALGWAHLEGPELGLLHVDAGHNEVPYHPDAVALLVDELERADSR
ncbi:MAG TPA: amino acid adenylation domain-containing protein [Acidimicrobiales bacterium]|nr:amino acid adenylation domain-containing protein [Acidimicrobiales bacterium]